MENLIPFSQVGQNPFKWKTQKGEFVSIVDMETSHLFYTLRMIWNHSMPKEAQVGDNIRKYQFSSYYTSKYTMQACYYILLELDSRTDLPVNLTFQFNQMKNWFKNRIGQYYEQITT